MEHFQRRPANSDPIGKRDFMDLQAVIERVLDQYTRKPQSDSVLLENISLTAATTVDIPHRLGRKIRGWKIVDSTAAATFFRDTTATANETRYLSIQASANTTISIEVF